MLISIQYHVNTKSNNLGNTTHFQNNMSKLKDFLSENLYEPTFPTIQPKLLSKKPSLSKIKQPIPPYFIPIPETKYLSNGRPEYFIQRNNTKGTQIFSKKETQKLINEGEATLNTLRSSMVISVPYTEDILREAAHKSNNITTVWRERPRYEFYMSDPNYESRKNPLLMDGFTYCEGSTLVAEILFNVRYMEREVGRNITIESMLDNWVCKHGGKTENNIFQKNTHGSVIITEFKFKNQCHLSNDHHYEVRALNGNYAYSLNLEFLPEFKTQRYYLSLCGFLAYAPVGEVITFINHYFFHGVQHFIFYINGHLSHWMNVLKDYSLNGIVELVDFTFPNKSHLFEQVVSMNSCNRRYRYTTQFMIFCDVDEFFMPINPNWRIIDVIQLYNTVYPNMDAFRVSIYL